MKKVYNKIKNFLSKLELALFKESAMQLFFPRRCPFCGKVIGYAVECENQKCREAVKKCMREKKRLAYETHYLGDLDSASSVYYYEDCVRDAILEMKFGGISCTGRDLGNLLAKELFGCTFYTKYGIVEVENALNSQMLYHAVVPVPASSKERGYNVPEILAKPVAKTLGVPLLSKALERTHFVKRQAGLGQMERFANVAGCFSVKKGVDLTGKNILIVDDVITTGATVSACAQALLKAGAENVFAVSLAAVRDEEEMKKLNLDNIKE